MPDASFAILAPDTKFWILPGHFFQSGELFLLNSSGFELRISFCVTREVKWKYAFCNGTYCKFGHARKRYCTPGNCSCFFSTTGHVTVVQRYNVWTKLC